MSVSNLILNEEKWSEVNEKIAAYGGDGKAASDALKKLYSLYTDDILVWLGNLFDTRIGGFYYSMSAKNSDSFLPDIESTYHAIVLLKNSGAISEYSDIPELMRKKIAGFICSLEDPENGYFYHPQWSRELTDMKTSRKVRDQNWAAYLSSTLDFDLPYPTASERLSDKKLNSRSISRDVFSSEESFLNYLQSLDWEGNSASSFHKIISQCGQIKVAGLNGVLIDYLNQIQDKETGFFTKTPNFYDAALMYGISALYSNSLGIRMPMAEVIAERIIFTFLDEISKVEPCDLYFIRNIWGAVEGLIKNLRMFGDTEDKKKADELLAQVQSKAIAAIEATAIRMAEYKRPTGAFSLRIEESPTTSQGVPVTTEKTLGGDMNATAIAVGMLRSIRYLLGISDLNLTIFTSEDFGKFVGAIDKI